jgi:hypothetical protein
MTIGLLILYGITTLYLLYKTDKLTDEFDAEWDMHNITIQKLLSLEGELCDLRSSISRRQAGVTCPPSEDVLTPHTLPPEFCACVTSTEM